MAQLESVHTLIGTAVSRSFSGGDFGEFPELDGTLTVPEVLRPYMNGRDVI